jgi:4-hydroxy-tetrahydrodipicolinate synthase
MFSGAITDLVTPMTDTELDFESFGELVAWQVEQGCHGLVVAGRTGEASALTMNEVFELVQRGIAIASGQIPVIVSVGAARPDDAIGIINHLQTLGPDAVLLRMPAGGSATPDGLYQFIRLIHDDTDCPILLDFSPDQDGCALDTTTLRRFADMSRLAGICQPDWSAPQLTDMLTLCPGRFSLLTMNDSMTPAFLAQGGHGCISSAANAAPDLYAALHDAWREQDFAAFIAARDLAMGLNLAMAHEHGAATAKYALQRLGLMSADVRLPLTPALPATRDAIDKTLAVIDQNAASSAGLAA